MNFKELIKIPIPSAPQTDIPAKASVFVKSPYYTKGGYNKTVKNFLYLAEIIEDMLIVTVYHGGEFMWRTFIDDTDYCTQKADNPRKSTAGVYSLTDYDQTYIPINGAGKTVKRYVDKYHKYDDLHTYKSLEAGIAKVEALQEHIRKSKTAERHRKIREATEECMLEIRPPIKPFTEWIKHQSSSIYIIYHTGDSFGVCTHCLKKVERGKSKWKHRQDIVCPHCRKRAKLLCSGRFRDGRIECHTEMFWYTQKTRSGCCVRLFETYYNLCKNTTYGYDKEELTPITNEWIIGIGSYERARVFLDPNGCIDQSFVWGNFMQMGENYWCRTNNVFLYAGFYTGNLRQALSNYEQLKYIPWNKVAQIAEKTYFFETIKTLIKRPWIEYLLKVGLNSLAYDFLKERYDERSAAEFADGKKNPEKNTSLAHILGLDRRRLREIMPYNPDIKELKLYKFLLRNRAGLEEWKFLKGFKDFYWRIYKALEYQPVSRYIRYIETQADLYFRGDYGSMVNVIEDYADYLSEAERADYNMEDTATINPKSLIIAHADSEIDARLENYKRNYAKYADELAAAAENIAKVKGIFYEDQHYRIAPIMSWEELLNESKILRHCVATYAGKYADGNCIIFGIRNIDTPDTPMYTLELSGDFRNVRQCRGFKNHTPPENIMKAVEKWHKNLILKNTEKAG